jgi:hypothetical protein
VQRGRALGHHCERVIQQGTPEQRLRALTAIRELTAVVDEFDGQRGSWHMEQHSGGGGSS